MSIPIINIWDEKTQQYVSIPAIKGDKGERGEQGPQGPQGIAGVAVQTSGYVAFNVTADGILQCTYSGDEQPNYYINDEGHLVLNV